MVFDLKQLIQKYNMNIKDVIHVGGHHGHEVKLYKQINPQCTIHIFEPHPETFKIMVQNLGGNGQNGVYCHPVALGSEDGRNITMYVETANAGQSNSLLKPKDHVKQYPHIRFDGLCSVRVLTLDTFKVGKTFNFMSIDVQGFELEVLKGAPETLKHIDYIIAEVNRAELYEGCPMVEDLDAFLLQYNLHRVETDWEGGTWGDALYIRR